MKAKCTWKGGDHEVAAVYIPWHMSAITPSVSFNHSRKWKLGFIKQESFTVAKQQFSQIRFHGTRICNDVPSLGIFVWSSLNRWTDKKVRWFGDGNNTPSYPLYSVAPEKLIGQISIELCSYWNWTKGSWEGNNLLFVSIYQKKVEQQKHKWPSMAEKHNFPKIGWKCLLLLLQANICYLQ